MAIVNYITRIDDRNTITGINPSAPASAQYLAIAEELGYSVSGIDTNGLSGNYQALKSLQQLGIEDGNYILNLKAYDPENKLDTDRDAIYIVSYDSENNPVADAYGYSDLSKTYNSVDSYINPFDPAVLSLVNSLYDQGILTQNMSTDQKMTALYNYIINNFSYIAEQKDDWNFPSETIANKGGDCEDLSILLNSAGLTVLMNDGVSYEEANKRLLTVAGISKTYGDHVYVEYTADNGTTYVLDPARAEQGTIKNLSQLTLAKDQNDFTVYFRFNDTKIFSGNVSQTEEAQHISTTDPAAQKYLESIDTTGFDGENPDQWAVSLFNAISSDFLFVTGSQSISTAQTVAEKMGTSENLCILFMNTLLGIAKQKGLNGEFAQRLNVSQATRDGEQAWVLRYTDESGTERIFDFSGEIVNPGEILKNVKTPDDLKKITSFVSTDSLTGKITFGTTYNLDQNLTRRSIQRLNPQQGYVSGDLHSSYPKLGTDDYANITQAFGSNANFATAYTTLNNMLTTTANATQTDPGNLAWFDENALKTRNCIAELANVSKYMEEATTSLAIDVSKVFAAPLQIIAGITAALCSLIPGVGNVGVNVPKMRTFNSEKYEKKRQELAGYRGAIAAFAMVQESMFDSYNIVSSELGWQEEGYKSMKASQIIQAETEYLNRAAGEFRKEGEGSVKTYNQLIETVMSRQYDEMQKAIDTVALIFGSISILAAIVIAAIGVPVGTTMVTTGMAMMAVPITAAAGFVMMVAGWFAKNVGGKAIGLASSSLSLFQTSNRALVTGLRSDKIKNQKMNGSFSSYASLQDVLKTTVTDRKTAYSSFSSNLGSSSMAGASLDNLSLQYGKLNDLCNLEFISNSSKLLFDSDEKILVIERDLQQLQNTNRVLFGLHSAKSTSRNMVHQEMTGQSGRTASTLAQEQLEQEQSYIMEKFNEMKQARQDFAQAQREYAMAEREATRARWKLVFEALGYIAGLITTFIPKAPGVASLMSAATALYNVFEDLLCPSLNDEMPMLDMDYIYSNSDQYGMLGGAMSDNNAFALLNTELTKGVAVNLTGNKVGQVSGSGENSGKTVDASTKVPTVSAPGSGSLSSQNQPKQSTIKTVSAATTTAIDGLDRTKQGTNPVSVSSSNYEMGDTGMALYSGNYQTMYRARIGYLRQKLTAMANQERLMYIFKRYSLESRNIIHQEMTNTTTYQVSSVADQCLSAEYQYTMSILGAYASREEQRIQSNNQKLDQHHNFWIKTLSAIAGPLSPLVPVIYNGIANNTAEDIDTSALERNSISEAVGGMGDDSQYWMADYQFPGVEANSSNADTAPVQFTSFIEVLAQNPETNTAGKINFGNAKTRVYRSNMTNVQAQINKYYGQTYYLANYQAVMSARSASRSMIHQVLTNISNLTLSGISRSALNADTQLIIQKSQDFSKTVNDLAKLKQKQNDSMKKMQNDAAKIAIMAVCAVIALIAILPDGDFMLWYDIMTASSMAANTIFDFIITWVDSAILSDIISKEEKDQYKTSMNALRNKKKGNAKYPSSADATSESDAPGLSESPEMEKIQLMALQAKLKMIDRIQEQMRKVARANRAAAGKVKATVSGIGGVQGIEAAEAVAGLESGQAQAIVQEMVNRADERASTKKQVQSWQQIVGGALRALTAVVDFINKFFTKDPNTGRTRVEEAKKQINDLNKARGEAYYVEVDGKKVKVNENADLKAAVKAVKEGTANPDQIKLVEENRNGFSNAELFFGNIVNTGLGSLLRDILGDGVMNGKKGPDVRADVAFKKAQDEYDAILKEEPKLDKAATDADRAAAEKAKLDKANDFAAKAAEESGKSGGMVFTANDIKTKRQESYNPGIVGSWNAGDAGGVIMYFLIAIAGIFTGKLFQYGYMGKGLYGKDSAGSDTATAVPGTTPGSEVTPGKDSVSLTGKPGDVAVTADPGIPGGASASVATETAGTTSVTASTDANTSSSSVVGQNVEFVGGSSAVSSKSSATALSDADKTALMKDMLSGKAKINISFRAIIGNDLTTVGDPSIMIAKGTGANGEFTPADYAALMAAPQDSEKGLVTRRVVEGLLSMGFSKEQILAILNKPDAVNYFASVTSAGEEASLRKQSAGLISGDKLGGFQIYNQGVIPGTSEATKGGRFFGIVDQVQTETARKPEEIATGLYEGLAQQLKGTSFDGATPTFNPGPPPTLTLTKDNGQTIALPVTEKDGKLSVSGEIPTTKPVSPEDQASGLLAGLNEKLTPALTPADYAAALASGDLKITYEGGKAIAVYSKTTPVDSYTSTDGKKKFTAIGDDKYKDGDGIIYTREGTTMKPDPGTKPKDIMSASEADENTPYKGSDDKFYMKNSKGGFTEYDPTANGGKGAFVDDAKARHLNADLTIKDNGTAAAVAKSGTTPVPTPGVYSFGATTANGGTGAGKVTAATVSQDANGSTVITFKKGDKTYVAKMGENGWEYTEEASGNKIKAEDLGMVGGAGGITVGDKGELRFNYDDSKAREQDTRDTWATGINNTLNALSRILDAWGEKDKYDKLMKQIEGTGMAALLMGLDPRDAMEILSAALGEVNKHSENVVQATAAMNDAIKTVLIGDGYNNTGTNTTGSLAGLLLDATTKAAAKKAATAAAEKAATASAVATAIDSGFPPSVSGSPEDLDKYAMYKYILENAAARKVYDDLRADIQKKLEKGGMKPEEAGPAAAKAAAEIMVSAIDPSAKIAPTADSKFAELIETTKTKAAVDAVAQTQTVAGAYPAVRKEYLTASGTSAYTKQFSEYLGALNAYTPVKGEYDKALQTVPGTNFKYYDDGNGNYVFPTMDPEGNAINTDLDAAKIKDIAATLPKNPKAADGQVNIVFGESDAKCIKLTFTVTPGVKAVTDAAGNITTPGVPASAKCVAAVPTDAYAADPASKVKAADFTELPATGVSVYKPEDAKAFAKYQQVRDLYTTIETIKNRPTYFEQATASDSPPVLEERKGSVTFTSGGTEYTCSYTRNPDGSVTNSIDPKTTDPTILKQADSTVKAEIDKSSETTTFNGTTYRYELKDDGKGGKTIIVTEPKLTTDIDRDKAAQAIAKSEELKLADTPTFVFVTPPATGKDGVSIPASAKAISYKGIDVTGKLADAEKNKNLYKGVVILDNADGTRTIYIDKDKLSIDEYDDLLKILNQTGEKSTKILIKTSADAAGNPIYGEEIDLGKDLNAFTLRNFVTGTLLPLLSRDLRIDLVSTSFADFTKGVGGVSAELTATVALLDNPEDLAAIAGVSDTLQRYGIAKEERIDALKDLYTSIGTFAGLTGHADWLISDTTGAAEAVDALIGMNDYEFMYPIINAQETLDKASGEIAKMDADIKTLDTQITSATGDAKTALIKQRDDLIAKRKNRQAELDHATAFLADKDIAALKPYIDAYNTATAELTKATADITDITKKMDAIKDHESQAYKDLAIELQKAQARSTHFTEAKKRAADTIKLKAGAKLAAAKAAAYREAAGPALTNPPYTEAELTAIKSYCIAHPENGAFVWDEASGGLYIKTPIDQKKIDSTIAGIFPEGSVSSPESAASRSKLLANLSVSVQKTQAVKETDRAYYLDCARQAQKAVTNITDRLAKTGMYSSHNKDNGTYDFSSPTAPATYTNPNDLELRTKAWDAINGLGKPGDDGKTADPKSVSLNIDGVLYTFEYKNGVYSVNGTAYTPPTVPTTPTDVDAALKKIGINLSEKAPEIKPSDATKPTGSEVIAGPEPTEFPAPPSDAAKICLAERQIDEIQETSDALAKASGPAAEAILKKVSPLSLTCAALIMRSEYQNLGLSPADSRAWAGIKAAGGIEYDIATIGAKEAQETIQSLKNDIKAIDDQLKTEKDSIKIKELTKIRDELKAKKAQLESRVRELQTKRNLWADWKTRMNAIQSAMILSSEQDRAQAYRDTQKTTAPQQSVFDRIALLGKQTESLMLLESKFKLERKMDELFTDKVIEASKKSSADIRKMRNEKIATALREFLEAAGVSKYTAVELNQLIGALLSNTSDKDVDISGFMDKILTKLSDNGLISVEDKTKFAEIKISYEKEAGDIETHATSYTRKELEDLLDQGIIDLTQYTTPIRMTREEFLDKYAAKIDLTTQQIIPETDPKVISLAQNLHEYIKDKKLHVLNSLMATKILRLLSFQMPVKLYMESWTANGLSSEGAYFRSVENKEHSLIYKAVDSFIEIDNPKPDSNTGGKSGEIGADGKPIGEIAPDGKPDKLKLTTLEYQDFCEALIQALKDNPNMTTDELKELIANLYAQAKTGNTPQGWKDLLAEARKEKSPDMSVLVYYGDKLNKSLAAVTYFNEHLAPALLETTAGMIKDIGTVFGIHDRSTPTWQAEGDKARYVDTLDKLLGEFHIGDADYLRWSTINDTAWEQRIAEGNLGTLSMEDAGGVQLERFEDTQINDYIQSCKLTETLNARETAKRVTAKFESAQALRAHLEILGKDREYLGDPGTPEQDIAFMYGKTSFWGVKGFGPNDPLAAVNTEARLEQANALLNLQAILRDAKREDSTAFFSPDQIITLANGTPIAVKNLQEKIVTTINNHYDTMRYEPPNKWKYDAASGKVFPDDCEPGKAVQDIAAKDILSKYPDLAKIPVPGTGLTVSITQILGSGIEKLKKDPVLKDVFPIIFTESPTGSGIYNNVAFLAGTPPAYTDGALGKLGLAGLVTGSAVEHDPCGVLYAEVRDMEKTDVIPAGTAPITYEAGTPTVSDGTSGSLDSPDSIATLTPDKSGDTKGALIGASPALEFGVTTSTPLTVSVRPETTPVSSAGTEPETIVTPKNIPYTAPNTGDTVNVITLLGEPIPKDWTGKAHVQAMGQADYYDTTADFEQYTGTLALERMWANAQAFVARYFDGAQIQGPPDENGYCKVMLGTKQVGMAKIDGNSIIVTSGKMESGVFKEDESLGRKELSIDLVLSLGRRTRDDESGEAGSRILINVTDLAGDKAISFKDIIPSAAEIDALAAARKSGTDAAFGKVFTIAATDPLKPKGMSLRGAISVAYNRQYAENFKTGLVYYIDEKTYEVEYRLGASKEGVVLSTPPASLAKILAKYGPAKMHYDPDKQQLFIALTETDLKEILADKNISQEDKDLIKSLYDNPIAKSNGSDRRISEAMEFETITTDVSFSPAEETFIASNPGLQYFEGPKGSGIHYFVTSAGELYESAPTTAEKPTKVTDRTFDIVAGELKMSRNIPTGRITIEKGSTIPGFEDGGIAEIAGDANWGAESITIKDINTGKLIYLQRTKGSTRENPVYIPVDASREGSLTLNTLTIASPSPLPGLDSGVYEVRKTGTSAELWSRDPISKEEKLVGTFDPAGGFVPADKSQPRIEGFSYNMKTGKVYRPFNGKDVKFPDLSAGPGTYKLLCTFTPALGGTQEAIVKALEAKYPGVSITLSNGTARFEKDGNLFEVTIDPSAKSGQAVSIEVSEFTPEKYTFTLDKPIFDDTGKIIIIDTKSVVTLGHDGIYTITTPAPDSKTLTFDEAGKCTTAGYERLSIGKNEKNVLQISYDPPPKYETIKAFDANTMLSMDVHYTYSPKSKDPDIKDMNKLKAHVLEQAFPPSGKLPEGYTLSDTGNRIEIKNEAGSIVFTASFEPSDTLPIETPLAVKYTETLKGSYTFTLEINIPGLTKGVAYTYDGTTLKDAATGEIKKLPDGYKIEIADADGKIKITTDELAVGGSGISLSFNGQTVSRIDPQPDGTYKAFGINIQGKEVEIGSLRESPATSGKYALTIGKETLLFDSKTKNMEVRRTKVAETQYRYAEATVPVLSVPKDAPIATPIQ